MPVDKQLTSIAKGDKIEDKFSNTGTILGITNKGSLLAFTDDVTGETRRALCRESTKVEES